MLYFVSGDSNFLTRISVHSVVYLKQNCKYFIKRVKNILLFANVCLKYERICVNANNFELSNYYVLRNRQQLPRQPKS